jgi:hypothetical protein
MDARMVTLIPKPGHADELVEFWDETVVGEITGCAGNRGFVLLKEPDGTAVHGLSFWDATADAEAARATFRRHMAAVSGHLAAEPQAHVADVAAGAGLTH